MKALWLFIKAVLKITESSIITKIQASCSWKKSKFALNRFSSILSYYSSFSVRLNKLSLLCFLNKTINVYTLPKMRAVVAFVLRVTNSAKP